MAQPQPIQPVPGPGRRATRTEQPEGAEGFQKELDLLKERKQEELDIVDKTLGPASEPYLRAKKQYDDAVRGVEHARIRVKNREPKRRHINPLVYATFALLFLALEAPLNKFVFDVIFGSIALYSWAGAITLGLILLLVAHFDGVALRQVWSEADRRLYVGKIIRALLLTTFLGIAVVALAVARYQFSIVGASVDLGSLVGSLDQVQTVDDVVQLVKLAFSNSSARLLAVANSGAILVAILFGMIGHDPDENYDAALRKQDQKERTLRRLDAAYERKLTRINRRYEPNIARLNDHIAAALQNATEPAAANQNA